MKEESNKHVAWIKKVFWYSCKFVLAAGIIYFILGGKFDAIWNNLRGFRLVWLIPAALLYFLHFFVGAWRWYKLARVLNFSLTLWEAVCLTMKSFFCSLIIPGGSIGGDFAKVGFLSTRAARGTKIEGAFTVLMDRIVGMIALFALAIVFTLSSIPLIVGIDAPEMYAIFGLSDHPELIRTGKYILIAVIVLLCLAGLGSCFVMFLHRRLEKTALGGWLMRKTDGMSHGAVGRMTAAVDMYRDNPWTLFNMVLVSAFGVHLNMVLIVYCLIRGLGGCIESPMALLTGVLLANIAGLIPFTPSGIGFRDYTIIKFVTAGGIAADKAETTAMLFTALILIANIICGIFFFIDGARGGKHGKE